MDALTDLVTVIDAEAEGLAQYLDTLPPDAWTHPSACAGWEVRDVVGHLTFVAEFYADVIARGVRGDVSPPPRFPGIDLAERSSFDAYISQTALAYRQRLGVQLLPTFKARCAALHHLMARLRPHEWEQPCWRFRWFGHPPARYFLVMTIQELAIHGWDLRAGLEPFPRLSGACVPVLVERAMQRLRLIPQLARFRLSATQSAPVRYRFEVRGEVPGTYDFVVDEAQIHSEPAGSAVANTTFRCATDTFILMMYKRLTLPEATAAGRVVADGERELIADFAQWLRGA
jgi:uncharacterized protein (TIGR03083 family)